MPLRPIHRIRLAIGVCALVLPALALIAIVAGVVLFRFDVLDLETSQLWLAVAAGVGCLALLVLAGGRAAGWISWRWLAMLALPAIAPLVVGAAAVDYLNKHPSTAEVSTDLVDPPAFEGPGATPFPESLAEVGRRRHPGMRSLTLRLPPAQAYAVARAVVEGREGWRVTQADPPETLQGTAVFGRFHYQRDWTLRVRPELAGGALIDMRIRSKPGEPDLGDNADIVQVVLGRIRVQALAPSGPAAAQGLQDPSGQQGRP